MYFFYGYNQFDAMDYMSTKNMISSSEYLFNYIFIRTHDDSYSDAAFCWIYDGKKYRFTTFDKWYGKKYDYYGE